MATQPQVATGPERHLTVEEKVQKVKELYADAPELGRAAVEKWLPNLTRELAASTAVQTAGRVGARQGKVSELTVIVPIAEGGAQRLRGLLQLMGGNFQLADKMGTVHDMRFVFLDNDTRLLFATAYDGEWDPYIDDFATKIPTELDLHFSNCEGWPGILSPSVKDWIARHQVTAEGWYVANPNLTVTEANRLERTGKALDEFLDKISG